MSVPGPEGFGTFVAEMDFGTAPPILDALDKLAADFNFGYLPHAFADELTAACSDWLRGRYGWDVDSGSIHPIADVIKGLELAITHYLSRPGSAVIVPTPAYLPFLIVPPMLGRKIIEVPTHNEGGYFTFDLAGIDRVFKDGGNLVIFCNPCNPLGRVFTIEEMTALSAVVDRHGDRVFADEIHAPLVYPGSQHVPYASVSQTAAAHSVTATSASKAWNPPGLKCAEIILTSDADRATWEDTGLFASHGASNPGVVANTAAFRHGEPWLTDVLSYLDTSRHDLREPLEEPLPDVGYRTPDGTYLAWLNFTAYDLPMSVGQLVTEQAKVVVVDGPEFGAAGLGFLRVNFATPRPILEQMILRMADAVRHPGMRWIKRSARSCRPRARRRKRRLRNMTSLGSVNAQLPQQFRTDPPGPLVCWAGESPSRAFFLVPAERAASRVGAVLRPGARVARTPCGSWTADVREPDSCLSGSATWQSWFSAAEAH